LRPALDFEWDRACNNCVDRWESRKRGPDEIIATVRDFLHRVKQVTGRTPLLYTNRGFLRDVGIESEEQEKRLTDGAKVWIFDVSDTDSDTEIANPKNNLPHVLWQFSWGALLTDGYTGTVDVDSYKGTEAKFRSDVIDAK
jgi:GH25 family lysozyme M1 (1,4-beta-N-acetylmuramidase)